MGGLSIQHIMIFLVLAILLLGRGKVSGLMGDVANGIKAFKKNMADDHADASMANSPAGVTPSGKIAQEEALKPVQTPVREPVQPS